MTSVAYVIGEKLPVEVVVYDPAGDPPGTSFFTIVLSDAPPPEEVDEHSGELEHASCLVDRFGQDVAVPLDLAVKHGCSVVRDPDTGVWQPDPEYFNREARRNCPFDAR